MIEALNVLTDMVTPAAFNLDRYPKEKDGIFEKQQSRARKALRACGGIRPIVQLLNYRRSVQHIDAIRLGAVQVTLFYYMLHHFKFN